MSALAGTGPLLRLALRRDRIMIGAWVYGLTAFAYTSVVGVKDLYPTAASRAAFAAGAGADPVTVALYGPAVDLQTLGGLSTWKMSAFGAVLVGVMSVVLVNRHTRAEEDTGRTELAGAGAVGRAAPLAAALAVAVVANLLVALVVAVALVVTGLPGAASLAFALGLAATGCVFAALAALAAQVAASARAVTAIGVAVIGIAYLLRAVGDAAAAGSWLTGLAWASPIGWAQDVRPFGPLRWQVLAISVVAALAAAAAAHALALRRDLGTGLLPSRPGRPAAGRGLHGPAGLAWRLQRGPFLAWAAGFAVYGLILGALAKGISALVGNGPAVKELFTKLGGSGGVSDAFLAAVMGMLGAVAAVYATQAALRLRAEENARLADPVLAGAVGRTRWVLSHLAFAVAGPVVLLALAGAGAGLADGAQTSDLAGALPRLLEAALAQVPAAWVLAGVAVALFGVAPRLAALAWAALAGFVFIGEFGSLLGLSRLVMDVSPFAHVPRLPGGAFSVVPLAWLAVVAAALAAAGLAAFRRRDLA